MKKNLILFFATLILVVQFSSCKKVITAVFKGVDVSVPEIQVTIPAIPVVSPFEVPLGDYPYHFNLDSAVKANTAGVFGAKDVSSIKLKQISINITNADALNNLANFESVRVTIKSNTNSTPAELFSTTFTDTFASSFTSTPTNGVELLSYLQGSDIVYTFYGKNRRITSKPLSISVTATVRAN